LVSTSALELATETVRMLMKIDDIVSWRRYCSFISFIINSL
jgi:chaperonin GroEL (HSP60 family)